MSGVRFEELGDADPPTRDHLLAAVRNGTTEALSVAQILGLIENGDGAVGGKQPLDAVLTALAQLAGAADRVPYFTGEETMGLTALTAFARTLLDDASASAMRATLELGSVATQGADNVAITGGAVSGIADLAVADGGTGASNPEAARANLSAPLSPQAGSFSSIQAAGIDAALPAGGTWAYFIFGVSSSTGAWQGTNVISAGVQAGGTTVGTGASGRTWLGFQWRVA